MYFMGMTVVMIVRRVMFMWMIMVMMVMTMVMSVVMREVHVKFHAGDGGFLLAGNVEMPTVELELF